MSPYGLNGSYAGVRYVTPYGDIDNRNSVTATYGVRPVLSLKTSIQLTGNGTMEDPYVVAS